jgi:hypothetical protein
MSSQYYNCILKVKASHPHAQAPRITRDVKSSDSRDSDSEQSGYQNTAVIKVYNFALLKTLHCASSTQNNATVSRKPTEQKNKFNSLIKDILKHNFNFVVIPDINVFFKTNWIWFSKFTSKVCFVLPSTISFSINIRI